MAEVSVADEPLLLPLVDDSGVIGLRRVRAVDVLLTTPASRWTVYVDVRAADVVAREQTLRFADAPMIFRIPTRGPYEGFENVPAPYLNATVDGQPTTTDELGV